MTAHKKHHKAHAEGEAAPADVTTRAEPGKTIFSAGSLDLIAVPTERPNVYVCMVDVPEFDYKVGDWKHLTEPYDEQVLLTAKAIATSLGVLAT